LKRRGFAVRSPWEYSVSFNASLVLQFSGSANLSLDFKSVENKDAFFTVQNI
jgi:hypothetical protein